MPASTLIKSEDALTIQVVVGTCGEVPKEYQTRHRNSPLVPIQEFESEEEATAFYDEKVRQYTWEFCTGSPNASTSCRLQVSGSRGMLPGDHKKRFTVDIWGFGYCILVRNCTVSYAQIREYRKTQTLPDHCPKGFPL